MNAEKLLRLKDEIIEKKSKISELKGKKMAILENLKKDWGCSSLEEADTKRIQMHETINSLKKKREKAVQKLQKQYDL